MLSANPKLLSGLRADPFPVLRSSLPTAASFTAMAMLAASLSIAMPHKAVAEDRDAAEKIFQAMSDYVSGHKAIHLTYNASLELVTDDLQKVAFASSGSISLMRPDKLRFTRKGGFVDLELTYDSKTVTALGKNLDVFARVPVEGPIDEALDTLTFDYDVQAPAADLLSSNPFERMMANVTEAKDLGSGVINGQECDHLAFRTRETDWEIWVAQGNAPYPCRFTITSKMMAMAPSYTIEITSWKTGDDVPADDFALAVGDAKEIKLEDMTEGFELAVDMAKENAQ